MLTFTFQCQNEAQFAALQQAAHFLAEMHQLAQTAPVGAILQERKGKKERGERKGDGTRRSLCDLHCNQEAVLSGAVATT